MLNNRVPKVYVTLQHLSWLTYIEIIFSQIVLLDYGIHHGLCLVAMLMTSRHITISPKFMSHYNIHQWLCHIIKSIKGYVALQFSSSITLALFYCDVN